MNILVEKLGNVVKERRDEGTPDSAVINALKEELQYAVLDFIYNHRAYSHLIMYGGTLLRIGYGLTRMSEDLDFQTDKKFDFGKFKNDLIVHFKKTYDVDIEMALKTERLTGTDVATVNFPNMLEEVGIKGHGIPTVLKIRFDVNYFAQASDFAIETIPVTKDTFAFSIRTYPISTLMASKIAAVLLRNKRGIGNEMSDCKPRDIYDLIWYMGKKIIPDVEYLKAIHARANADMEARNVLEVFDKLKKRVPNLDDKLFRHDLTPFFYNPAEFDEWHRNWKQRFMMLINSYEIFEVKNNESKPYINKAYVAVDFSSDIRYFNFHFSTIHPEGGSVKFICALSEYWYMFSDLKISAGYRRKDIEDQIESLDGKALTDLDYEYAGLLYSKIEDYLKRNDFVVLQPELKTKLIRATADALNIKTQIFLDRHLLIKEKFEDLL